MTDLTTKPASTATRAILEEARTRLPFADRQDFDEQARGFIAGFSSPQIMAETGQPAWDMGRFAFLDEVERLDTVHPSLHRQSRLNNNYGLYEVVPGIYQVRGADLANMTMVAGKSGWIVFDTLTCAETARAAWALFQEHVGAGLPVSAIVFSHTHIDHWGGVRGLVDEDDVRAGKVPIIAPEGFMEYTISENVYAGNAMIRRAFYQYGLLLPVGPEGFVGQGLGQSTAKGNTGLIAPTRLVREPVEEIEIDGIAMVFQNTPGTEAPVEMNTYIPSMKALWMAENVSHGMHNIYTLRGAEVRDPLRWSKYIARALQLFGREAEVMFGAHHWPRWGNDRIQDVMRAQRDMYAHLNNRVLHLLNSGVTINEIHNVYTPPASLQQSWHCRGYHGSPQHNARGIAQRYLGFWDCNPVTLIPPPAEESAALFVQMAGGADAVMARARTLNDDGSYLLSAEILDRLVRAEPQNAGARALLADTLEQVGYQQENPGLRNSFLAGAFELRHGIPSGAAPKSTGPDVIRTMATELFLDFLAIRMDSARAEDLSFRINLSTPDTGETFAVELANATLTNLPGALHEAPDLSLTIDRRDLETVMMGAATLQDQLADGTARAEGDVSILQTLAGLMVDFDPRFPVMPGTAATGAPPHAGEFEAATGEAIAE